MSDSNIQTPQNPNKFPTDDKLKTQCVADDTIRGRIDQTDQSTETQELVYRRIELAKPANMRYQWHKELDLEILIPGIMDNGEMENVDKSNASTFAQNGSKSGDTNVGGSLKDFSDPIP